jgi:LysR family transcriptional regulator, regulator for bpeEF and oprC
LAHLPLTGYINSLLKDGRLVQVLPTYGAGELPLFVIYPRNRHLSARLQAFVDWVVALYAKKMTISSS